MSDESRQSWTGSGAYGGPVNDVTACTVPAPSPFDQKLVRSRQQCLQVACVRSIPEQAEARNRPVQPGQPELLPELEPPELLEPPPPLEDEPPELLEPLPPLEDEPPEPLEAESLLDDEDLLEELEESLEELDEPLSLVLDFSLLDAASCAAFSRLRFFVP